MSTNTVKIFNDDNEYITLFDLSKSQKYSLEYLLGAASQGKLKSFKMGDDWLTTMDWFNDHKQSIKKSIQLATADQELEQNSWVDFLPENNFRIKFLPQLFLVLIIFTIFSFSLSWLVYSSSGHKLANSASRLTSIKYLVGNYFLLGVSQVYNYNNNYFSFLGGRSLEVVNLLNHSLISLGQDTVYLTLVLDQQIGQNKISDEAITEKFNELVSGLKTKYQAVAGSSAIRKQIYFNEFENDSQTSQ